MAYCSRCGVEVDYNVRKCPLCQFKIPQIEDDVIADVDRFPKAENVYIKEQEELKNVIFIIITIVALASCVLMVFLNTVFLGRLTWGRYSLVSVIATWGYLFIFFGYIRKYNFAILAFSANTAILIYFIDSFNNSLDWFFSVGLPIVLLAFLIAYTIGAIYRKRKKTIFNTIAYIMLGISVFLMGIEVALDFYLRGKIKMVWSIITGIQLIAVALLLLYLSYKLPQKYKEELKKKFHM